MDQEEINERFAEVDLNKDGKIDFNEYQKDAFGDEDRDEHGNLKLDEDDMVFNFFTCSLVYSFYTFYSIC